MNLQQHLKLRILLRLPWNHAIRDRYKFLERQIVELMWALSPASNFQQMYSYDQTIAGEKILADHLRGKRAIERLLLDPTLKTKRRLYRAAIGGNGDILSIEKELG